MMMADENVRMCDKCTPFQGKHQSVCPDAGPQASHSDGPAAARVPPVSAGGHEDIYSRLREPLPGGQPSPTVPARRYLASERGEPGPSWAEQHKDDTFLRVRPKPADGSGGTCPDHGAEFLMNVGGKMRCLPPDAGCAFFYDCCQS